MTGPAEVVRTSFCRICQSYCGVTVTVRDGVVERVKGDPQNPASQGFTCMKGRSLPAQINHPARLLHPLRRAADGRLVPVPAAMALDEVAARVGEIIDNYGPRAVALYAGNGILGHAAGNIVANRLWRAIRSPMTFSSGSIDQPGKPLAHAIHGRWGAGMAAPADADVWMFLGTNPLVSLWAGMGIANPGAELRRIRRGGTRLVVVDPRRTRTAALADLHLQIRPGEDATLLAGLIRHILVTGGADDEFCRRHVAGLEELRKAVDPFDLDLVARRTGLDAAEVTEVARLFAGARRAGTAAGTGANMSGWGTLTEYLMLCLMSVCGSWPRAGDPVRNPGVLVPSREWRAQAEPVPRSWEGGEASRVRGLRRSSLGMPTAAAADEILLDGEGRVRALFVIGGNPVAAWPDQLRTVEAMRKLDLLVCVELFETATTEFAHYVFAGKHSLEVPATTQLMEEAGISYPTMANWPSPYAMYTPAVAEPPPGSEVLDEAEVFHQLARRLGITLTLRGRPLDMNTPSLPVDEVISASAEGVRVPLAEVKRHEHGYTGESELVVQAAADGDGSRLDVGFPAMMGQLTRLAVQAPPDSAFPYLLVSRRMVEVCNSALINLEGAPAYNPAYLHPDDLAELGAEPGDVVELTSARGSIRAIAQPEEELLRGVVSCAHAWGGASPGEGHFQAAGSSTGRLVSVSERFDDISGIPLMSAIPLRVTRVPGPGQRPAMEVIRGGPGPDPGR
ncbi:MAG TPA: molybdopterin-dependent oxidoreductase [Trebonia sp.]|jgi:anaerobic selenocysteine-containing dehydrogenase